MSFIKSLKNGQATLEYFILFAVVTAIVIAALASDGSFLSSVKNKMQGEGGFFQKAAQRIIN